MPTTSLDYLQAAAKITRNIGGWVPALGTAISMTYGYRASDPGVANGVFPYPTGTSIGGFQQFTAGEIDVAEAAFKHWAEAANITFNRVGTGNTGAGAYTNSANMLLGGFTTDAAATGAYDGYALRQYSVSNGVYTRTAQVWIDNTNTNLTNPTFPNGAWRLIAHEIGHAIGLSHPGAYNAAPGVTITYSQHAEYVEDTFQYSIMSYFNETNTGANFGRQRPLTPMMHDIAAIQRIYGANFTTRAGDTVYGFNSNTGDPVYTFNSATSERVFCIWDGGGRDTIDASGYTLPSLINLNAGSFSDIGPLTLSGGISTGQAMIGNVSIAYGATIENAIGGGGNDTLIGNGANNVFTANGGTNSLTGGGGWDQGSYAVASGAATIVRNASGSVTINGAGFSDTLTGVELARFTDRDVALREAARGDLNGEGTSDLVLQSGGTVVDWIMQNGAYQAGSVITTGATGFTVVGKGDLDADGDADLVLQSGGTVVDWIMQNGAYQAGNVVTTGATGFTVRGSGDFDKDGDADLVLQSGGTVVVWRMQNGVYQSGSVITTGAAGFNVVGTGDLDGDGDADIVLQSGGTVVDWIMQNGAYQAGNVITTGATGFSVVGTGDFNGDGTSDIALQSGGTVIDWIMQNGAYQSGNVITTGAAGFTVVATGDYNNDGTADLALQSGGTVVDWLMKNGTFLSGNVITTGAAGFTVV